MMISKPPAPVECTFTVPPEVETAWRKGNKDALATFCVQMARDLATYCARTYEGNRTDRH